MRTLHLFCTVMLILALGVSASWAREVGGVDVPEMMAADKTELTLNGAGIREKWFLDLYVAGLYLPSSTQDAREIIQKDEPMAIRMEIISSMITGDKMADATREGFVRATDGNTAPIQTEIDALIDVFKDQIEIGDIYELVYVPGEGTRVIKNAQLHTVVEGLPFKQALFGIWLSDDPVQKNLKKDLLGNK